MQGDLDKYLVHYNQNRPHQGRNMRDRTPMAVFKSGLPKKEKKSRVKPAAKAA